MTVLSPVIGFGAHAGVCFLEMPGSVCRLMFKPGLQISVSGSVFGIAGQL